MNFLYLNGRMLSADEAKVSVFDRGFAYGDALFETLKVLGGKPVFMREHYGRLITGLKDAGFGAIPDIKELTRQATGLAEKNGVVSGRLRLLVTRGTPTGAMESGPDGPDPKEGLEPTVLMTIEVFTGFPPEIYESGVAVQTVGANRGRYAFLKSSGLMAMIKAREAARDAGASEAILTTGHGRVLEGAYSNIFFIAGRNLVTAPVSDPILPGVTRQKVIDIATELGLAVEEQALKLEGPGLGEYAAFLTSSLLGICPVSTFDGTGIKLDIETCHRLAEELAVLERQDIGSIALP